MLRIRIRDLVPFWPGIRDGKFRIRNPRPMLSRSATLLFSGDRAPQSHWWILLINVILYISRYTYRYATFFKLFLISYEHRHGSLDLLCFIKNIQIELPHFLSPLLFYSSLDFHQIFFYRLTEEGNYAGNQLIGKSFFDLVHAQDIHSVMPAFKNRKFCPSVCRVLFTLNR